MNEDTPRKFRRLINSEDNTRAEPPSQPLRAADPIPSRPALDKNNMPLPRRVDELDTDGTRVTPAAYEVQTSRRYAAQVPPPPGGLPAFQLNVRSWGCLIRGLIVVVFIAVIIGVCLGSLAVYEYYSIASSLPSI